MDECALLLANILNHGLDDEWHRFEWVFGWHSKIFPAKPLNLQYFYVNMCYYVLFPILLNNHLPQLHIFKFDWLSSDRHLNIIIHLTLIVKRPVLLSLLLNINKYHYSSIWVSEGTEHHYECYLFFHDDVPKWKERLFWCLTSYNGCHIIWYQFNGRAIEIFAIACHPIILIWIMMEWNMGGCQYSDFLIYLRQLENKAYLPMWIH